MTLADLRYLVALARERHFGRAADACFVSQPTLSVAVKKLERELGVVLFERSPHEVRLTPTGERVVAQATKVLSETAQLVEIAAAGQDPLAGPLRLGVIPTIGPWLLPRLVPILKERAPAMPLFLEEGFTHRLLEQLRAAELDLVILALPVDDPGLATRAIYDEQFKVLVPAAHPWAKAREIEPRALLDTHLLMLGAGNCFRDQVLDLCAVASRRSGVSPDVLEGSSLETIRLMVASGVGVSVMPATAVDAIGPRDSLLRVRPFSGPPPVRRVGLAWRRTFPRQRVIEVVHRAIVKCRLPGTSTVPPSAAG